ncbi:hypothetical protein AAGV28_06960 [Flavobacterium sp. FZUC8N2.13]|uniref:Uncharacterized protein n=1 Tax=Flavobacterium zubiriense TaxID=3138075 RepID=A0ABV4TCJ4_9FLAO
MYSCYEIKKIFALCNTVFEVFKACEAFEAIIKDGDMPVERERFLKRESVVRSRQIKTFKR